MLIMEMICEFKEVINWIYSTQNRIPIIQYITQKLGVVLGFKILTTFISDDQLTL